jgi:putative transposase
MVGPSALDLGILARRSWRTTTTENLTELQRPWQNPFAERLVGSIRRECLDHVIVLGEKHLRRIPKTYFDYYLHSRTHLSLAKDAPTTRAVQEEAGEMVEFPQVGGPPHRYERRAA